VFLVRPRLADLCAAPTTCGLQFDGGASYAISGSSMARIGNDHRKERLLVR
jgi:hypothetical protein